MATVKFRLKSNAKKQNTIYVYMSLGRGNLFEVKTGFEIEPQDWQEKLSFPKQNTPENKNLHSNLKKLESFTHDSLNTANSKGELIDKFWLERKIKECFNRVEKKDSEILVNHIQHIIDTASTRKVKGRNGLGLSESRIKGYKTFLGVIRAYQTKIGKTIRLTEINHNFIDDFRRWMLITKVFSLNYAGKQLDNLKAVCADAERMEIAVHPYSKNIESFSESDEDRHIVTLSFEELRKIHAIEMPSKSLENAKKWLLIGCELGQRGEDLLKISINNCRYKDELFLVDVLQQKGKKEVAVVIMNHEIIDLLENKMPHRISLQKLNKYIKEVCKEAGLVVLTEGYKITVDPNGVKRKTLGTYPKWELIASHSFRRSYATNYYKKIPTAILMTSTGHSRESTFLKYINKQVDKDDNAKMFSLYYKQMNEDSNYENNEN